MSVNGSMPIASEAVAANLSDAAEMQAMPMNETATHAATGAAEEHHKDPTAFGVVDATVLVSLAMIVVIVLMLAKKVPGIIGTSLDKKIAAIRANLDEAASLRADAEALKADYEKKAKAAAKEADALLSHAKEEADAIVAQAQTDAAALIERRGKMAEEKIAAAERTAIAEVRATAANAAATAAAALIADKHDANADKALVDASIATLGGASLN